MEPMGSRTRTSLLHIDASFALAAHLRLEILGRTWAGRLNQMDLTRPSSKLKWNKPSKQVDYSRMSMNGLRSCLIKVSQYKWQGKWLSCRILRSSRILFTATRRWILGRLSNFSSALKTHLIFSKYSSLKINRPQTESQRLRQLPNTPPRGRINLVAS